MTLEMLFSAIAVIGVVINILLALNNAHRGGSTRDRAEGERIAIIETELKQVHESVLRIESDSKLYRNLEARTIALEANDKLIIHRLETLEAKSGGAP